MTSAYFLYLKIEKIATQQYISHFRTISLMIDTSEIMTEYANDK